MGCSINVCNSLLRQSVLDGWVGGAWALSGWGLSWSVFGYLSVLASFILHKLINKNILLVAMYLWIVGVSFVVGGLTMFSHASGFIPSVIGFVFLVGVTFYNKAYQIENSTGKYRLMHAYLYHYVAIFGFLVGEYLGVEEVILVALITLYYFVLTILGYY